MGTGSWACCIRMPQFLAKGDRSYWHRLKNEKPGVCFSAFFFSLITIHHQTCQAAQWEGVLDTVIYTETEQRDCLPYHCATVTSQSFSLGLSSPKQNQTRCLDDPVQQLTVLGCCLHTKSDMKSNSFCPKKSSGSS